MSTLRDGIPSPPVPRFHALRGVCGRQPFMNALERVFLRRGHPADRILTCQAIPVSASVRVVHK